MPLRIVLPLAAVAALAVPAGAHADLHHTVAPGESLTSIAAADRVSINALAGANRLSRDARLIAGSVLRIPPPGSGTRSPAAPQSVRGSPPMLRRYTVQPGDTLTGVAARHGVSVSYLATLNHLRPTALLIAGATLTLSGTAPRTVTARPTTRRYVIQPGDTLSGVAARHRVSTSYLAALNRLRPTALLIAGATLTVPGTARRTVTARRPTRRYVVQPGDTLTGVAARDGVSASYLAALNRLRPTALLIAGATLTVPGTEPTRGGPPYPTVQRVTVSQVEQIAAENRVAAWLGAAIAWEESGFNNALVSSADARGVMQILPGTWDWIQDTLTLGVPLAPASAVDNVRGGVLYLRALLRATGGDLRLAIAGYVQGLASVRRNGMFAVTRQYVSDVMALRQRFAGP
jgi:N-acetylmuramoyl-L-alanine amidase